MRNTQLIRWTRMIERMMDGRAKTMDDFADTHEGLAKKTLMRDLMGLVSVTELEITTFIRDKVRFWRMDKKFNATVILDRKKRCKQCRETKFMDEFRKNLASPDGHAPVCKQCRREDYNRWMANNRERAKAVKRKWYKRNKNRINKQRREEHRIKVTYGGETD